MNLENYDKQELLSDISTIINDLLQGINDLHRVISLVRDEKEIISYEQSYCKQCKEPCGRSNAEILKCITAKKNMEKKQRDDRNQQYTKEYLEQDLQEIIIDLEKKEEHLKKIMEKIQKGVSHS